MSTLQLNCIKKAVFDYVLEIDDKSSSGMSHLSACVL